MGTNEANPTRKYYSKLETSPTVRNNEQQCPTDGGWGWVVCLGAFVVNFLTVGQQNSAGVVHSILVDEYKSNRGDTGKVHYYLAFASSVNPLCDGVGSVLIRVH